MAVLRQRKRSRFVNLLLRLGTDFKLTVAAIDLFFRGTRPWGGSGVLERY
jgi:hypothetical protein